jgi:anti-anti-sigma factor
MMDVGCSLQSPVLRISLSGPFDRLASVKVPEYIKRYRTSQYSQIIIDLSCVSIVDSAGVDLLFLLSRIMRMKGGQLILLNPQAHVRDMLSRTDIPNLAKITCDPDSTLTAA